MTVFDDLAAAMGDLVGDAALGGWVLGAVVILALLMPIGLLVFARGRGEASGSLFVLFVAGFAIAFNVGVGWWEPWSIVFIGLLIAFGWLIAGRSEGGV